MPGRPRRGPLGRRGRPARPLVIRSASGTRTVPAREFTDGPYQTVLDEAEILTEARIPIRPGSAARTRRSSVEPATGPSPPPVPPSCWTGTRSADVGIGLAAVGAEHSVRRRRGVPLGRELTDKTIARAGELAAAAANPAADQRGPVVYKRHLADELTARVLRRAAARARRAEEELTCR